MLPNENDMIDCIQNIWSSNSVVRFNFEKVIRNSIEYEYFIQNNIQTHLKIFDFFVIFFVFFYFIYLQFYFWSFWIWTLLESYGYSNTNLSKVKLHKIESLLDVVVL